MKATIASGSPSGVLFLSSRIFLRALLPVTLVAGMFVGSLAVASPIAPGNLLVTTRVIGGMATPGSLLEFTLAGVEIQSVQIPNVVETLDTRDVIMGANGLAYVYNGTFRPFMSTYNSSTSMWSDRSFPGWSTVNTVTYGGIATRGDFVYVTDMNTVGGEPAGIVRFDLSDSSAQRFNVVVSGISGDPIDLTMGFDGLLYVLLEDGRTVRAYDPVTMAFQRTISVSEHVNAIAVDQNGNIFAAAFGPELYHFNSLGAVVDSLSLVPILGLGGRLSDIDLSAHGVLAIGTLVNVVVLSDTTLDNASSFVADRSSNTTTTFVSFTQEVPEPATVALVLGGCVGFGMSRRNGTKPAPGGTASLILTPQELLDRLTALVPPRIHRHHYCGVLAPNSPLRCGHRPRTGRDFN